MMTPQNYARLCQLFEAVQRFAPSRRKAFLKEACVDTPSLRDELETMLAHDDAAGRDGFLEQPPPFNLRSILFDEVADDGIIGNRLGPYRIESRIATGGMGTVYFATRIDDYDQHVAIKLIRRGMDSHDLLRRFRSERQLLAGLTHPNIARLLDGGSTDDGRPYFVMEHIAGKRINDYCDSRALSTAERVQLFRSVCLAVQFAHDQTIIHRDLKPGNILVTKDGTPKVTDFGLAKKLTAGQAAHGTPALTQSGAIIGTPSYMAPEQATRSDHSIGPAADVYSLGAVFYELLTGRPPFRADTPLDTVLQLLSEDPVPPNRLHPKLPKDLETICLKCLQKEPSRRYATARDLADDLSRWLAGEPIKARPVGRIERAYRWCRRNPKFAGLAACLVLAVTAGFAGIFSMWTLADRQRIRAEENESLAIEAVDKMYTRVAEEWLVADPRTQKIQRDILLQALEFFDRLSRRHVNSQRLRLRKAQASHFVARIQLRLGQITEAEAAVNQQIEVLEDLINESPAEDRFQFELFHALILLAGIQSDAGQSQESAKSYSHALTIIEFLAQKFPDKPDYRDALANQGNAWGQILCRKKDFAAAEQRFRTSLTIAEQLVDEYPDKRTPPHYLKNVAFSWHCLGVLFQDTARMDDAEHAFRQSTEAASKVADDFPDERGHRFELAVFLRNLAAFLLAQGKAPEAEAFARRNLACVQELANDSPDELRAQRNIPIALYLLGSVCYYSGNLEEASGSFHRCKDLFEDVLRRWPDDLQSCSALGSLLALSPEPDLQDPSRGIALLEQCVAIDLTNPSWWRDLGGVRYRAGDWIGALTALHKSLECDGGVEYYTRFLLAMSHWQLGKHDQARECLDQAVRWMGNHAPRDPELHRYRNEAERLVLSAHR